MTTTFDPEILAPVATATAGKPYLNQPARPMLARDADAMYWMSRYVERAEHIARQLLVNSNLLIDVGDLAPKLQERQWQNILTVMRLDELPTDGSAGVGYRIAQHMTFSRDNPNSAAICLTRARENARAIRGDISAEMWEHINTLYWSLRSDETRARFEESPDDLYREIMTGSMLFQGLTDQTLAHDQRWLFTQLGKFFERIDVTCRIIETKYDLLQSNAAAFEAPLRNIFWMGVLRSCCSIEAYRRNLLGDMDPNKVAAFLILERNFPRTIRCCVDAAHHAISEIRTGINPNAIDPAERILGRLGAQLEYAEPAEIQSIGLPAYLQQIQSSINDAAIEIQKIYFLH